MLINFAFFDYAFPEYIAIYASLPQSKMADLDRWIDIAKECKYLPEHDLKVLVCRLISFQIKILLSVLFFWV